MQSISLAGVASYLPEKIIENDFFGEAITLNKNKMFSGVLKRRHVAEHETAVDMIENATNKLIDKLNLNPAKDIDILLTNVTLPDQIFTGSGAPVSQRIGACPGIVLDVHNSGCVSFIYMMDLASSLIRAGKGKNALICNVQNTAGQIFAQSEVRKKPQSAVPGDGCGVGYLTLSDESPILSIVHHCHPDHAEDMFGSSDDGKKYWETRTEQGYIDFTEAKIASVIRRGNKLVPAVIEEACALAGLSTKKIDMLITNQPNLFFLRNWREAIELLEEKHVETFSEYGNLFGAAIPINLDEAINARKIKPDDRIVLAGFSHAGDFSAAAVVHWKTH